MVRRCPLPRPLEINVRLRLVQIEQELHHTSLLLRVFSIRHSSKSWLSADGNVVVTSPANSCLLYILQSKPRPYDYVFSAGCGTQRGGCEDETPCCPQPRSSTCGPDQVCLQMNRRRYPRHAFEGLCSQEATYGPVSLAVKAAR